MVWRLSPTHHAFPPPEEADPNGLLAVGGDLHPGRVLRGYREGIFPWYSTDQPILWWSPDPRAVLKPRELRIPRSLRKRIRQQPYRITLDTAFDQVVEACASIERPDQAGTWITDEMAQTYSALHRAGFAHSAEAWHNDELVGGLYGIEVGSVFCGESMFAMASDASKIVFVHVVRQLLRWNFDLIDCQMKTKHLERFGAQDVSREQFLSHLRLARDLERPKKNWEFDQDLDLTDIDLR